MNMGDVAEWSGLPAKTIRYYEDIGLIRARQGESGYRGIRQRRRVQARVPRTGAVARFLDRGVPGASRALQ